MHIYDMIIIGGGPAGYTAALYASRAGFDTVLLEKLAAGGQMTLTGDIDNYPGFDEGIDGFTLGMKMQQSAERFGSKTEYCEVLDVDFSKSFKKVITSNGDLYGKTVVIASGANPRELGIEGEEKLIGKGIHYCAHCDGRFYKDKTVVVVGGGNSAAEDALYLSKLAKKIYLIHRRDKLRATKTYQEALFKSKNIEFLWNSEVIQFISDNRINGVKIKNVTDKIITEFSCDGIFISIGRKPATSFLKNSVNIDENGYIIADESTKTNIEGVYAAGDVRTKVLRQVVTAVSDGAVAVHYAEEYISKINDRM